MDRKVHALWNCGACDYVRETVVEVNGIEWLNWSGFEKDHRPTHHCPTNKNTTLTRRPYLVSLQWFNFDGTYE